MCSGRKYMFLLWWVECSIHVCCSSIFLLIISSCIWHGHLINHMWILWPSLKVKYSHFQVLFLTAPFQVCQFLVCVILMIWSLILAPNTFAFHVLRLYRCCWVTVTRWVKSLSNPLFPRGILHSWVNLGPAILSGNVLQNLPRHAICQSNALRKPVVPYCHLVVTYFSLTTP